MKFKEWLKIKEMAGTYAIVKNCNPTTTYRVWGACSDLKSRKNNNGKKKMDKQ